jgi:hypothetical protein
MINSVVMRRADQREFTAGRGQYGLQAEQR